LADAPVLAMFRQKIRFSFLSLLFYFCIGCATPKPPSLGFLQQYPWLKQSPSSKDLFVYKDPKIKLSRYSNIIVDPILVSGKEKKLDPYDENRLSKFFTNELKINFNQGYHVVEDPFGPTLRVRGVVQVWESAPWLNVHWSSSLSGLGIGGASMEIEFVDALNGRSVICFSGSQKGDRFKKIDGLTDWTHTEKILSRWAKEMKDIFGEFHGRRQIF